MFKHFAAALKNQEPHDELTAATSRAVQENGAAASRLKELLGKALEGPGIKPLRIGAQHNGH